MIDNLEMKIQRAKGRLLKMHYESGVGHIGGNLSCLDVLIVLHHQVLRPDDTFLLSKGHAAGALYVTLWSKGLLSDADLATFHRDDTKLSGHPSPGYLPEIPFATGSLGHGLSLAGGIALGKRLRGTQGRVYCVLSDGEWQEGSTWEALTFIAHQHLPVTMIIDTNGLQGFGTTQEVAGQGALTKRIQAYGVPVTEIDGHDTCEILGAINYFAMGPEAIVAHTRKGNGVSFMEDRMEWHYLPLTEAQYLQASREVLCK